MQTTNCPGCNEPVSPLADYVRERRINWHVGCWLKPKIDAARLDGMKAQREYEVAAANARAQAEAKAQKDRAELEAAQKLAALNVQREKDRIAALTKQETEKLKQADNKGEAKDRFAIIELE